MKLNPSMFILCNLWYKFLEPYKLYILYQYTIFLLTYTCSENIIPFSDYNMHLYTHPLAKKFCEKFQFRCIICCQNSDQMVIVIIKKLQIANVICLRDTLSQSLLAWLPIGISWGPWAKRTSQTALWGSATEWTTVVGL